MFLVEITTWTEFAKVKACTFIAVFGMCLFFFLNTAVASTESVTPCSECACSDQKVEGAMTMSSVLPSSFSSIAFVSVMSAGSALLARKKLNEKMWASD